MDNDNYKHQNVENFILQNLLNVSNEYGTKLIKHAPLELGWDEPSLIFA